MQAQFMNWEWRKMAIVNAIAVLCLPLAAWADANWMPWITASSPSNVHHDAAYDSANQRIVLCGRRNVGGGVTGQAECYFFTVAGGWQSGPVINSPGGADIEVAYDSDRVVTVLYTVTNTIPLVFELVGNVWTQRAFATPPVVCADGALMRYHPLIQKTVLVGATNLGATANSETWLWDGTNWSQAAGSPRGAAGGSMTYDAARGAMVLLPYFATNTWTFDGTTWTSHQPSQVPTPPVWVGKMAYDSVNELAIAFGGETSVPSYPTNTWAWNGSEWLMLATSNYPPGTIDMAFLWFPPLNAIVMHGGWGPGDAWAWRNSVWVFSNAPALSAPANVTASDGAYADKVAVVWQPVDAATGYRVYRSESNDTVLASVLGTSTTTNYDDTSATAGMLYYYWVRATNTVSVSYFSDPDSGYRSGSAPAAPANLSASDGTFADRVQVTWSAVSNASGYTVWRSGTNDTNSVSLLAEGIVATNYNDTNAAESVIYYYWLKATNTAGASAFSSPDSGWRSSSAAGVCVGADFDGDAKADPAVFNTNGTWKIKRSSGGYSLLTLTGFLGASGATGLAADFDGDAKADPAVYYAELELWAVKLSSLNYLAPTVLTSFGGSGWQALAGDFDGDRLADPALYNTNGTWKVKLSTAGYALVTTDLLGRAGWTAVAADFDGDGKVDPAIYNASSGSWIVVLSTMNYGTAIIDPWFLGSAGYIGLAADFDGDGYADPAVAQTSTGNWKLKLSSGNYSLLDLPDFLGE